MADAAPLLTVPALLLLATGAMALGAVLIGRSAGVPASIAVLAPIAEAARAVRTLPILPRGAVPERLCAVGLLAVAVLRTLLLPVDGRALLDPPGGIAALLVLDLLAWACWSRLAERRPGLLAASGRALAVELPVAVALAGPVVAAAGRTGLPAVVAAQHDLPFAVRMPGALLVLLAVVLLTPWSAPAPVPPHAHLTGFDRLLVEGGRAASLVAASAAAAVVLLGADGPIRLLGATALIAAVVVLAARRFPVLRPDRAARVALAVLLPLAALQLAVVVALAVLAGGA